MKRFAIIFFITVVLINSAQAVDQKIMIISFKDPAVTKAIEAALGQAPGFKCRVENLDALKGFLTHDKLGLIVKQKPRWDTDFVIVGNSFRDGSIMKLYCEIISMETGRFFSLTSDYVPEELSKIAGKTVNLLLQKSSFLNRVTADKVVDRERSIVSFDIKTKGPEILTLNITYDPSRPDPELQNMDISPKEIIRDGDKVFKVASVEGNVIEFQYTYKNGECTGVKMSTDIPVMASRGEIVKKLSVISVGGNVINFTFVWQDKELKEVRIEPALNPFSEVK